MRRPLSALVLVLAVAAAATAADHAHAPAAADGAAPVLPGLGTWHHAVSCAPGAQAWFDQGLRLVYAFNHDEAIRAFREAARRDPRCAMAWWGVGLALGPNYNLALDDERAKAALDAVARARALAPHASPAERDYVAALALRYGPPGQGDRKALDRAYADAMRGVARRHPDDADAATLFAESLMDLRPWDLWSTDGEPRPETPEIVATLEGVLARWPDHPGANHYYIHAVEASSHPERALPSAKRLPGLMPGAGHLVHMPSHVYMRVGRYGDATEANVQAIDADRAYLELAKPEGVYPLMYVPHNIHFLWSAASMEGRSADALSAARRIGDQIGPDAMRAMPMLEYFAPTPWLALARFGRWSELAAVPAPAPEFPFALAMWHHAHGRALANTGDLDGARRERDALLAIAAAMPADRIVADNQPARVHLELAAAVLAGEIAAREGRTDDAVRAFEDAVRLEDALPYTEPPPWYQPSRHLLGAVLVDAGRTQAAEVVYRDDLRRHPENGWALLGLAQSLRERDPAAASDSQQRFHAAWRRADVLLERSRF